MKNLVNIFISLLLFTCGNNSIKAQQDLPESNGKNFIGVTKEFDVNNYKDWQKVELSKFSLYVPKEFKIEKWIGIDATGWRYKNQNVNFFVHSGSFALDGPLKTQQKLPSYKEKAGFIDGIFTRMWFYEDKSEDNPYAGYPYIGILTFKDPVIKGNKYAIIVTAKDSNGQELAEKIFLSLKFNKTEQINVNKVENKTVTPLNKQKKN